MRWLWLILTLPFASALLLVLLRSRCSRGPAATVGGVLSLFIVAVPAAVAMVVALVLKVYRRVKPLARRDEGIT